jgi:hypothetical protein
MRLFAHKQSMLNLETEVLKVDSRAHHFQAPARSAGRRRGSEDREGIELYDADRMIVK